MRTIRVSISPTGATIVDAEGFVGGDCKTVTKSLEQAIAGKSVDIETTLKAEYRETAKQKAPMQLESW